MTTPPLLDNAPGQDALSYRVGRYGDFFEAMVARLSDTRAPFAPLAALRTRAPDDPTLAFIDAFAAVCDVLTFYQERLVNEGYLRTATEPRSIAELARLTAYRPKAGLASSVFLAFTADADSTLTLSAGARAQSVPPAGQTAQTFETQADLLVQGAWNALKPRLSQPTQARPDLSQLFIDGIAAGLKPNDPLLLVVDDAPTLRRIESVTVQPDRKRTLVALQPTAATAPKSDDKTVVSAASESVATSAPSDPTAATSSAGDSSADSNEIIDIARRLAHDAAIAPTSNPPDSTGLRRTSQSLISPTSDAALALAAGVSTAERSKVFKALDETLLAPAAKLEVHAFRTVTAPSGARAPPRTVDEAGRLLAPPQEWDLAEATFGKPARLTIEITSAQDGSAALSETAIYARATDSAERERLQISSTLSYRGAKLTLTVDPKAVTSTGELSSIGEVDCTLQRLDATGLVIGYDFAGQPVSLLVSASADGGPSVVNQIASMAATNLAVTEAARGARIEVSGDLALQTGSKPTETSNVLYLDGVFDTVTPGSWVAFDAPAVDGQPAPPSPTKITAGGVANVSRTAYGQTARSTRLALQSDWIDPQRATFSRAIRETSVFANSARLTLVDEDITEPVAQTAGSPTLELDGFTPGLTSGRWLIVTGERVDLPGSTSAEVAMLAGANHTGTPDAPARRALDGQSFRAGETVHTRLTFAAPLAYAYKRDTVSILANVARASVGESVDEILGSGSGALANQAFALKKPPLTYVSASTLSGSASTLQIYINGLRWTEVDTLGEQGPTARVFVTHPAAGGGVAVRFGDGVHGARLPTGADNVRARYRSGLGASGDVDAQTITTLLSRPLGLKAVTNPLSATGGADAESADDIRATAPVGLVSLSRLVAVQDYQDFAQTFAGVAKASAKRFAGPDGPLVHVTIAAADDGTISQSSDLWTALSSALDQFGDAEHEVQLAARTARLALISANIAVDPDRLWIDVEPVVRKRLLKTFSFRRRELGRTLYESDVVSAIQAVPGVAYVDLQLLSSIAPPAKATDLARAVERGGAGDVPARLAHVTGETGARQVAPAELVYLSDALPDMLVLNEIAS